MSVNFLSGAVHFLGFPSTARQTTAPVGSETNTRTPVGPLNLQQAPTAAMRMYASSPQSNHRGGGGGGHQQRLMADPDGKVRKVTGKGLFMDTGGSVR